MAYNEKSAERLRKVLANVANVTERKMMGGLVFMVNDHMCCGINGDSLMVRVGPEARESAMKERYVGPLDIGGGRQPRAFVCVEPEGYAGKKAFAAWVDRGIEFVGTLPAKESRAKAKAGKKRERRSK